jgi:hypothetical protein
MEPELAQRIVHGLRDAGISFISLKIRWSTRRIVLLDIWNEPKAKKFSKVVAKVAGVTDVSQIPF